MKKIKVIINSRTSGKYKRETIDGRSHLVTIMMPIRGDITMNKRFYSDKDVTLSFMQLNMLPAPNGHPTVNGIAVNAFHPVANNKHNIGGFIRNPRKKGKKVFCDLLIDEKIANNSGEGKEVIKRILSGEKIGVSTGLAVEHITNKNGVDDFGKEFNQVVSGYHFDHVAILLNEPAAGEHAGTELILNENDEEIFVYNAQWNIEDINENEIPKKLQELIKSDKVTNWLGEVNTEEKYFYFSQCNSMNDEIHTKFKQHYDIDHDNKVVLLNDAEKINSRSQTINEVKKMDKAKLVLAIIGNSANKYTVSDNDRLTAMSDDDLLKIVSNTDEEGAKKILTNSGFNFTEYDNFVSNKSSFEIYLENKAKVDKVMIDNIVKNSEYTEDILKGKSSAELDIINNMLTPKKIAKRIAEQGQQQVTNADDNNDVDYS